MITLKVQSADYGGWQYQSYDYEYGSYDAEVTPEAQEFTDFTTFPPHANAHCHVSFLQPKVLFYQ